MAKTKKAAPSRRPAKPKGQLPAPRVSPVRKHRKWHRRPGYLAIGAILILGVIGFGIQQILAWRHRAASVAVERRALRSIDGSMKLAQSSLTPVIQELSKSPDDLLAGKMTPAAFKTQADQWLDTFTKMSSSLRSRTVPSDLKTTQALLIQGTTIYLDAARDFQLAGLSSEPAVRAQAIKDAKTLMYHANFVFRTAAVALARDKIRLGTAKSADRQLAGQQASPPEDEAPAAPPAASTSSGGASSGGG